MNYDGALEFLESTKKIGSKPGLTVIGQLLKELGSPEKDMAFVHVAGTNGKGSVSTYIATILARAGYLTGRFSSPAVFAYEEIIQILTVYQNSKNTPTTCFSPEEQNQEELGTKVQATSIKPKTATLVQTTSIQKEDYTFCMEQIQEACNRMVKVGIDHPTSFEVETALAFLYFRRKKCDITVLETGMGGSLDATNIIPTAKCAVLTSISMDHMEYLGNSLGEIAGHKAGIIKPEIPVVSYEQEPEAEEVIKKVTQSQKTNLTIADFSAINIRRMDMAGTEFDYKDKKGLTIKLLGMNQVYNAVTAILAIEALNGNGYFVNINHIREGLQEAAWPGRFECIKEEPVIILDGAHNADAALALGKNIRTYLQGKVLYYIMGVFKDKDYKSVLRHTADLSIKIFCITPPGPRGLPSKQLKEEALKLGYNAEDAGDIHNAFRLIITEAAANKLSSKDYAILAFGSLSFLNDVREEANKHLFN
ncbi:MAG: fgs 2 [Anaerocolumna sp.]|jgi:dihydrofolate synthase/folylpolyglutamate synthase|nr:fgs 2 [Anaerocolumna sp.]